VKRPKSVPRVIHRWYWRWAAVLALMAIAFAVRLVIAHHYPGITPFMIFFPAVLLAALLDGMWAGIAATVLSALLAAWWFFEPIGTFSGKTPSAILNLTLFTVYGILLSLVIEGFHRYRENLGAALEEAAVAEERRKAGEAQQANEARLAREKDFSDHLINSLPGIFYLNAQSGKLLRWNKNLETVSGYSSRELAGMKMPDFIADDEKELVRQRVTELFEDGAATVEADLVLKDGERRPHFLTGTRVMVEGKPCLLGFGFDISGRKQAEAALQASEEKFARAFNTSPAAVAISRLSDGVLLDVNQAAETLFGCTREEVLGRSAARFWPSPQDRAQRMKQLLDDGFIYNCEQTMVRASGEPFLVLMSITRMNVGGQELILTTFVDLSERKRAEAALRETTRRFQTIVDHAPIAIYVKDRDGRFVFGNRKLEHYTGQPLERLLGMTDYDFASKKDADRWRENDLSVLEGQRAEFEEAGTDRDGRPYFNISMKFPLSDESGMAVEVCGISADITERKRVEEELKRINRILKALRHSDQAILHATGEQEFLGEVCKVIVEDCGHAMVWIGFAENDEKKSVRIVAHAGFEAGYLETLEVTWGEGERGLGPTGRSIRTGKPVICHDMLTDPWYAPWREEATKRGYASSISVPFRLSAQDCGTITIYSRERDAFSEAEVELLTELARDVEFGVQTLRMRAAHARAEQELIQSREMLGLFIEEAPVAMAMFDREMRYLHASRRWKSDYGLGDRSLTGQSHYDVFPEIPGEWKEAHRRGLAGESLNSDGDRFVRADGSQQWIRWELRPWYETGGAQGGVLILTEDITERKKAEAALLESERLSYQREQLRALTERLQEAREEERTRVARDLHDDIGQILTAVKMDLIWIGKRVANCELTVRQRLEGAVKLINDGVRSVRKICTGLRPAVLDDLGLAAAIEWQADDFSARTGIGCRVSLPPVVLNLTGDHATTFFRILQECLTNVSRHAGARSVDVSLHMDGDDLVMMVKDDGKGFRESSRATSLGILGMKERAQFCGGQLTIDSSAGKGTAMTLRVPMRPGQSNEDSNANSDRG